MVSTALLVLGVGLSLVAAGHALLNKRDPRAALGWILACLMMPGLGALLYWMLGVNRIRTRARKYREEGKGLSAGGSGGTTGRDSDWQAPVTIPEEYHPLVHTAEAVTGRRLLPGNTVRALYGGEEAYPEMLKAIAGASRTVSLSTYILDGDATGRRFAEALSTAARRGVEVRLLLDGFGRLMSRPNALRTLRRHGVRCAQFLPLWPPRNRLHINLRNHRKLLVVDRETGFTGGMNIGDRHLVRDEDNPHRVNDVHFHLEGPAVLRMEQVFLEDWAFATGEDVESPEIPGDLAEEPVMCRGICDGPNEDFETLHRILIGALHAARFRLLIQTPYFVPERPLITALSAAALRGVDVRILLPGVTDHPLVSWASTARLWEVVEHGVRVLSQPPPFDHTKLLLVDDRYVLVGSANLDARSLRLNFEFNLEVYDRELNVELAGHFDEACARSREVTLGELDGRPLAIRFRDAFAKLLSPYL